MSEHQRRGIAKVFLSSTYRDLHGMRGHLLNQLVSALDTGAMEKFISRGEGPQTTSLRELKESDIAIFLISHYYGTDIQHCEFTKTCKVDCEMKSGGKSGRISYTWCEYRTAQAEGKPHSTYIVDEGWPSRDGAPKIWKMRDEIERETCPRISNDDKGVEKVLADLVDNLIALYSEGAIDFERFCGRRELLKELFDKMRKSVNVYGVGGIGKTTVCEVGLFLCRLMGRKVVYIGLEEAYASGTGYEFASEKLIPYRLPDVTIDDIIDLLKLGELKDTDQETKIYSILQKLESDNIILFIDNFRGGEGLKELIKKGNNLNRGCILISSKKELETYYRISVEGIEQEERGNLVEIMASRMSKTIHKKEQERIEEIAEGHPVATYLLVSNIGKVNMETLEDFKGGLDFSRDADVKEYMNRVIESGISSEAYGLLKDLSVIEGELDTDRLYEAFSGFSYSRKTVGELIDASIMEREGNTLVWKYSQIRDAVFEDVPARHELAAEYYRKKLEKSGDAKDLIEMLYHLTKVEYKDEILEAFLGLANTIREEDPVMRLLPKLGEEIKNHVKKEDEGVTYGTLGNIYWDISKYREKAENCKKAVKAYEEALKVYTFEEFPMDYAMTQNNLGTAYSTLAEVEEKAENCKKAVKVYEEALKVRTFEEFPIQYAMTQNNLGTAYRTLAEVEEKAENCKKAVKAYEEALKVYTFEEFPIQYAMTQNNLGTAYRTLAEVEEKAENCKKAVKAYEEALKVYTFEEFPMDYAMTQNNLGTAYSTLAEVEEKAENCKKAVKAYEEALKVYTFEEFPIQYAMTQNNLGTAYSTLAEVEEKAENCKKAVKAYEEALEIFTKEKFPETHQIVEHNLRNLLNFCKDQL